MAPPLDPSCTACALHASAKTVCMAGTGGTPCDILCLEQAPSKEDDLLGHPCGQLLYNTMVREAGNRGLAFRVDYTTRCRPPKDRNPYTRERSTCVNTYLWDEIRKADPRLILCFGSSAAAGMLGVAKFAVAENRQVVYQVDEPGDQPTSSYAMVVTFQPRTCIMNRNFFPYWVEDIRWAVQQTIMTSI